MRLTPLDIRKQEFKKAMRGLDPEEVYAFLTTIADEYEAVLNDNKALRERLLELDDKVQEYRSMEKTLRDTLLTAERATSDAKENARREAELIIKQAEIDAEKGVRDIKENAMKLRQEVQALRRQRESYISRMKMLAESHIKFLDSAEDDFKADDNFLDQAESRLSHRIERASPSRAQTPSAPAPAPRAATPPRPVAAPRPPQATPHPAAPRPANAPPAPAQRPAPRQGDTPNAQARPAPRPASDNGGQVAPDQAPLSELLDQVIEGQRSVIDQVRPRPNPDAGAMDTNPVRPAPRPVPEQPKRKTWSLDRLKGDILGTSQPDDEED